MKRFLEQTFEEIGITEENHYQFAIFLRSDNGTEFVNHKVEEFCSKINVITKQGPIYSPWVQGVEILNKTIKNKIKKYLISVPDTQ